MEGWIDAITLLATHALVLVYGLCVGLCVGLALRRQFEAVASSRSDPDLRTQEDP